MVVQEGGNCDEGRGKFRKRKLYSSDWSCPISGTEYKYTLQ